MTPSSENRMQRVHYLDTVGGVLIVYMICLHLMQRTGLTGTPAFHFLGTVFFFFLPWFFFKSGMMSKQRPFRDEATAVFRRLIVPFVVFSFLGWAFHCGYLWITGDRDPVHYLLTPAKDLYLNGAVTGNLALWFLFTLTLVRLLWNLLSRFLPLWAILAAGGAAGLLFHYFLPDFHPYYLANTCLGLFFFCCGRLLKDRQFQRPYPMIALVVAVAMPVFVPSLVDMKNNLTLFGYHPVWLAACPAGCVAIDFLVSRIGRRGLFNWLGRHAMTLLVTHWIVLEQAQLIYETILGKSAYAVWVYAFACLLILPLLCLLFERPRLSFLVGSSR